MTLVEKVKKSIEKGQLTQAELARKINLSETTVSQWLGGKYKGNVKNLEEKIDQYLNFEEEKLEKAIPNLSFIKTSVAEDVFTAAALCQRNCEIGLVHGGAGLGKTTAIEEYARRTHGVIVLEPDEDCPARMIVEELYEKLGLSGQTKVPGMKKEILAKLKNSGWLIIVDEGENLKTACFKTLRKLHDRSKYTFGLLFVGTKKLYNNLLRLKGDFEYLTNRIGYNFELEKLREGDVQEMVSSVIKDDNEIWKQYFACTNGNARILSKTLKRSLELAQMNNTKVNDRMIKQCREMLIA